MQKVDRAIRHTRACVKCWKLVHVIVYLILMGDNHKTLFITLPGSSLRATFSAILSRGPLHGQLGSSSAPARLDIRWADSKPPTTASKTDLSKPRRTNLDAIGKIWPNYSTSDIGLKNRDIDIFVKIQGILQKLRNPLEFCIVAHNGKCV